MRVKKFGKSANIWRRYEQKFAAYFLGHPVIIIYTVGHKNVPPNFCPYRCQLLTDFQIFLLAIMTIYNKSIIIYFTTP